MANIHPNLTLLQLQPTLQADPKTTSLPPKKRFRPEWPLDSERPDGLFVPHNYNEDDQRTSHPTCLPCGATTLTFKSYKTLVKQEKYLTDFTIFPDLPLELRRLIWKRSLPGPRVVELLYDAETGVCKSSSPVPTNLQVSRESREEALQYYELSFGTNRSPPRVFFNFNIDELYMGVGSFSPADQAYPLAIFVSHIAKKDSSRIRYMAHDSNCDGLLNLTFTEQDFNSPTFDHGTIPYELPSLEAVTIVGSHTTSTQGGYFDGDVVLSQAEDNPGEFHAWSLDNQGVASQWVLPVHGPVFVSDEEISMCWGDLESAIFERRDIKIKNIRYASPERLARDERWRSRVDFLSTTVYCVNHDGVGHGLPMGCLYAATDILHTLIFLSISNPATYQTIIQKMAEECGYFIDPVGVHLGQSGCVCPIGHGVRSVYAEELIVGLDLRRIIAGLDIEMRGALQWVQQS